MRAIIGPNGAGKTTMMDVITGKTRPDDGEVLFGADTDLTRLDEAAIAELGIGRKFQKPTVFESHTVLDNLVLALEGDRASCVHAAALGVTAAERRPDRGDAGDDRASPSTATAAPRELSHGQKQWLEIGMLLVQEPELLLVDEPVAGMTDAETEQTAALLREIAGPAAWSWSSTTWRSSARSACKVTVLHEGSVLAEGAIDQVQERPAGRRGLSWALSAMLEVERRRPALRRRDRAAPASRSGRDGAGHLPARPQRRRQDQPAAGDHRRAPVSAGQIRGRARTSPRLPTLERARRGIAWVPQGREIFPLLTVRENLETGFARAAAPAAPGARRDLRAFPGAEDHARAGAAATSPAASSSSWRSRGRW